jgi:hypothetical protein
LSVDAVQERLIWLAEPAVAIRLKGADGGVVSPPEDPEARNATICMIHCAAGLSVAVAV